jgi:hypothetical protein
VQLARASILDGALAFCDGRLTAEQLRALHANLHQAELDLRTIEGASVEPFDREQPPTEDAQDLEELGAALERAGPPGRQDALGLDETLRSLDAKLARLEGEFGEGKINAAQYQAVRRHYLEQREITQRLHQMYPKSDRWRKIVEEGKTGFLIELNEAVCRYAGIYDMRSKQLFVSQGERPPTEMEFLELLSAFGTGPLEGSGRRVTSTRGDDGSVVLLVPGARAAVLLWYTQDPAAWQVRVAREVLFHFETANRSTLDRPSHQELILPQLDRLVGA